MSKNRDRVRPKAEDIEETAEPTSLPPTGRRRRFPTFTITVALALLALVAFAPTILCFTPYATGLVASAAKDQIAGTLEAQSVSLGWFSPITLRGITVKDNEGATIGTVESLVVGKSLLGLITNSSDLGTITIDKPNIVVVARPDGSNIEDLLAPLLSKPASGGATPSVIVEIRDGLVKLVDGTKEQSWELTPLAAHLESPRGTQQAWNVSLQTKLQDRGLSAKLSHTLGDTSTTAAAIEADRFPLEPLQPILTRLLGPVRLAGAVSGKIEAELSDGGKKQRVAFDNVEAAEVAFASQRHMPFSTAIYRAHASTHDIAVG